MTRAPLGNIFNSKCCSVFFSFLFLFFPFFKILLAVFVMFVCLARLGTESRLKKHVEESRKMDRMMLVAQEVWSYLWFFKFTDDFFFKRQWCADQRVYCPEGKTPTIVSSQALSSRVLHTVLLTGPQGDAE